MRRSGDLSKNLRTVQICQKAKDSMALLRRPGPWMVLAGAGMCTGGRILNHLQNHLPDPTTLVVMVGYQSRGSVGRALLDGAKEVRIAGQKVKVRAKTHLFGGLSGHAGQSDLLNWFGIARLFPPARHPHPRRGRAAQGAPPSAFSSGSACRPRCRRIARRLISESLDWSAEFDRGDNH